MHKSNHNHHDGIQDLIVSTITTGNQQQSQPVGEDRAILSPSEKTDTKIPPVVGRRQLAAAPEGAGSHSELRSAQPPSQQSSASTAYGISQQVRE